MAKTLVLAEKPSVGKDIAKVLHCNSNHNQYCEGNQYVVTWAFGHLVTLADPEKYDAKYKTWELNDLPMLPEQLELEIIKQTAGQYNQVKRLLNRGDIKDVVIATDAGREGELVARWILLKAKNKKPIKRLWISSVTKKAIQDGFANLKDGKEYMNLFHSATARAQADWLVGINATRALTCKFNAQLSCGRVQTPTLAMIESKEEQIRNFKAKDYYGISILSNKILFTWKDNKNQHSSFNESQIDEIIKESQGKDLEIVEIKKQLKKKQPPLLFDLTTLQQEAHQRYGFSAKQTLSIMQSLYEYHKILTYPRTDSKHITDDIVPTIKHRLDACFVGEYKDVISLINVKGLNSKQLAIVNNQKVSDHHAIIPTEEPVILSRLDDGEFKIFNLVVKRFLASLLPSYEYEQTKILAKIGNQNFEAQGNRVVNLGWKAAYETIIDEEQEDDDLESQNLPVLKTKDRLIVENIKKTSGQTKPPARFNEGTLLAAMENPTRYLNEKDKELSKTLINTGGLGTVATRADIIEKLFNSFLIEKRQEAIHLTSKGKQLLALVPEELKSPALTGQWEQKLSSIAKGNLDSRGFIKEIRKYTIDIVDDIKKSDAKFKHDGITTKKCPKCGKFLLSVKGKKGEMLVCQDRECNHRENISQVTNARCPTCHKKLKLVGSGEAKTFICGCGYSEKLAAFTKRKENDKSKASKSDVYKYMKSQEKVVNNPFAEAFANLKVNDKNKK